jgi:steroid delta-isomerase-like uncharacterized protein
VAGRRLADCADQVTRSLLARLRRDTRTATPKVISKSATFVDGNISDWSFAPDVVNTTGGACGERIYSDKQRRAVGAYRIVEQHIRLENEHDLEGVLRTFGDAARYDDEAWGEHYKGGNGVRLFYEQLMKALPDLEIEVQRRHVTDDAVLVEVMIRGTHLGEWRGLPATGRRVEVPLCGVYTFDSEDRLAGEKIYYDRATVLRQLGVFHEPQSVLGQICIFGDSSGHDCAGAC